MPFEFETEPKIETKKKQNNRARKREKDSRNIVRVHVILHTAVVYYIIQFVQIWITTIKNANIKVEKAIINTEKATLEDKEVNIAAEKGEHSAEGAKVSEKALAKF